MLCGTIKVLKLDCTNMLQSYSPEQACYYATIVSLLNLAVTTILTSALESEDAKCLAAFQCPNKAMSYKFEGSYIRPDLVIQWTTRATANEIICSPEGKSKVDPLYWYNPESFVENKKSITSEVPSVQATTFVQVLPRVLPNLADMLYVAKGPSNIFLFWSDPFGVLRSHRYSLHEDENDPKAPSFESIILRYVATVMKPPPHLPAWDPIMKIKNVDEKPVWASPHSANSCNDRHQILGLHAHSRQTRVFANEKEERAVKVYWRDSDRHFHEGDILSKIKGVPGVKQVDISEDVKLDENKLLKTSRIHSGENPGIMDQLEESTRPCRIKHRSVLLSVREPLEKREAAQEFFEAVHDSVEGEYDMRIV